MVLFLFLIIHYFKDLYLKHFVVGLDKLLYLLAHSSKSSVSLNFALVFTYLTPESWNAFFARTFILNILFSLNTASFHMYFFFSSTESWNLSTYFISVMFMCCQNPCPLFYFPGSFLRNYLHICQVRIYVN